MNARQSDGSDARQMDVQVIATEALAVLGTGRQIAPFSARYPHFGLDDAYRVTAAVRMKRETRGERPLGRKIGFTNRTIWAEYNVHAPMWGYIYDCTIHDFSKSAENFSLNGFAEPRIEPEIVFGLASAPAPGMDEHALLGCIEWIAHGFEIVQSIFPSWKFIATDTIAAYGLHGALLVGPRHSVAARFQDWERELSVFEIDLFRNGDLADRGHAANVLDGPVAALRHLVEMLAYDRINPPLTPGEIVTTGTLTRALPVVAGETWTTELTGIPLEGARIHFV
jgi:2-oxo-3-hexenedioate decarboxylase